MLSADKQALEAQLKLSSLQIRDKELSLFTSNLNAIATQGALLAGFAYSGLTGYSFDELYGTMNILKTLYFGSTCFAMCFQLLVVVNAVLGSVFGPGLALRGPDGSMDAAVDGMLEEKNRVYKCFCWGMFFYMLSSLFFAWMKFSLGVSVCVTIILLYGLLVVYAHTTRIQLKFEIQEGREVSGQVKLGAFDPEVAFSSKGASFKTGKLISGEGRKEVPRNQNTKKGFRKLEDQDY